MTNLKLFVGALMVLCFVGCYDTTVPKKEKNAAILHLLNQNPPGWTYKVDGVELYMPIPPVDKESEKLAREYLPSVVETPLGTRFEWGGGPAMVDLVIEDDVRIIMNRNSFIMRRGVVELDKKGVNKLALIAAEKYPDFFVANNPEQLTDIMILNLSGLGLIKIGKPQHVEVHKVVIDNWAPNLIEELNEDNEVGSDNIRQDEEPRKLEGFKPADLKREIKSAKDI